MAKWLLFDEFRLCVLVPAGRPVPGIQRVLAGRAFLARLRAVVRDLVARTPTLHRVRVTVTRGF
jgi:hypothetical protein